MNKRAFIFHISNIVLFSTKQNFKTKYYQLKIFILFLIRK